MDGRLISEVGKAVQEFASWLARFGEVSYDYQTFFASTLGGKAKALYYSRPFVGTVAVSPMVFCEAFLPSGRRFFARPMRFPIADAHYAMGFALLCREVGDEYYQEAVRFLNALELSRCPGYEHYCWGYPFDWVTGKNGVVKSGTPLITTTPYAYEAFRQVYELDHEGRWLVICRSIAQHVVSDIKDFETSATGSCCSYTPHDQRGGVVNASAYRASLLARAAADLSDDRYGRIGKRNLDFVLQGQNPDGSWFYALDGEKEFIDHFHTCFVLKALAKIERLTGSEECRRSIDRGIEFYLKHLFDKDGLPKPFAKAPRLTLYRHELYDYAECINLCLLLRHRIDALDETLNTVVIDLLNRWVKEDGSFRSRKLLIGWDNVPMHRWAQSQLFRSLCLLLHEERFTQGGVSRIPDVRGGGPSGVEIEKMAHSSSGKSNHQPAVGPDGRRRNAPWRSVSRSRSGCLRIGRPRWAS